MGKLHSIILLILFAAIAAPACVADEKLDTAPIISALVEVAQDADEGVRYAGFDALQRQPGSAELRELFWRGLDDESLRIRTLSLDKVVDLDGPTDKVLERLVLLMSNSTDGADLQLGRRARSHLVSIGAPAIPYLIEALKEDDASISAIYALGQIPLGEHRSTVTTRLTALLKGENKDVRIAAVQSLVLIISAAARSEAKSQ